jgi:hypothetical protein
MTAPFMMKGLAQVITRCDSEKVEKLTQLDSGRGAGFDGFCLSEPQG